MPEKADKGRRRFLRTSVMAGAALPLSALVHQRRVRAMPKAEDSHALGYINNAGEADHADHEEGQRCDNCAFWAGEEAHGWGTCHHPRFSGVMVNSGG